MQFFLNQNNHVISTSYKSVYLIYFPVILLSGEGSTREVQMGEELKLNT